MDANYNTLDNIPPIFDTEYWVKQKLLYLTKNSTDFDNNKIVGITKNSSTEGQYPGALVTKVYSYDDINNAITNTPVLTLIMDETSSYITSQSSGASVTFNNGNNPKIKRLTTLNFLVASIALKSGSTALPNQIGNVTDDFLLIFNLIGWDNANNDTVDINYTTGGTVTAGASSDYDIDIIDSNHFVVATSALAGLVQIYEINSTFDGITLLTQLSNTDSTQRSTVNTIKVIDSSHFMVSRFIPTTNVSELIVYSFDTSYNITELKRITLASGTALRDFTFEIDTDNKYGVIFGYDPGAPSGHANIYSGYISYNSDFSTVNASIQEDPYLTDGMNVDIYSFNTQPEIKPISNNYFLVTTGNGASINYYLYKQATNYPELILRSGWATDDKRNITSISNLIINKNIFISSWADSSSSSVWGRMSTFHVYDRTQLNQSINMSVYSNGAWQQGIRGWIYEDGGWRLMKKADVYTNSTLNNPFIESYEFAQPSITSVVWGSDTSTVDVIISCSKAWTVSYMPSWITYQVGIMLTNYDANPPTKVFEDYTSLGTFGTGYILRLTPSSTTSERSDNITIAIDGADILTIPVSQGVAQSDPTISMSNSAFSVVSHDETVTLNSVDVPFDITPSATQTNVKFTLYKDGTALDNQVIIEGTLEQNTKYSNSFTLANAATYNETYEIKVELI